MNQSLNNSYITISSHCEREQRNDDLNLITDLRIKLAISEFNVSEFREESRRDTKLEAKEIIIRNLHKTVEMLTSNSKNSLTLHSVGIQSVVTSVQPVEKATQTLSVSLAKCINTTAFNEFQKDTVGARIVPRNKESIGNIAPSNILTSYLKKAKIEKQKILLVGDSHFGGISNVVLSVLTEQSSSC